MSSLADLLDACREEILRRWTERVRQGLAPGPRSEVEFRDHIPDYLDRLAAVLRRPSPSAMMTAEAAEVARQHGAQRFRIGFNLEAVVRECAVLHRLILELAKEHDLPVTLDEMLTLADFISNAIAEGVAEHTRQRDHADHTAREMGQERDAQLANLLRSLGDAVIATDAAGRVTFMNPVAEELTEWPQAEAQGRPSAEIFRILHERTRAAVESPVDQVIREGASVRLAQHTVLVRRSGAEVPIDDSAAPSRSASGELIGTVLVFRDVTEARRKDATLRTFRALIEASTDFIAFGGMDGRLEYLNPAGRRLVGVESLEAARQLNSADILTPETSAQAMVTVMPAVLAGDYFHGESVFRSLTTGEAIPMLQDIFAIRGADGDVLAVATVSRDLRETKRIEAERARLLAEAQEARAEAEAERQKLHDVFEQAPVAICILEGPRHTFTFANPAYLALVGESELVGKPVLVALPALADQGIEGLLDGVVAKGVPFVGNEVPLKLHGEEEFSYYNFVYQPKRNARGEVDGVLVCASEVTTQVQALQRAETEVRARKAVEDHLRRVVAVTQVGSWEIDIETEGLVADARFREMFGLTPDQPFDLDQALGILHDEDRARVTRAIEDALAGKNAGRYEAQYRTTRADGDARWVSARGQVEFDGEGKAVRLLGTGIDITARKEAELARAGLLEALAQQSSLQVSVREGPGLVFTMANALFQENVAAGRSVLGRPMMEALPELKGQGYEELMQRVLDTGQPLIGREARVELDRGDGTRREAFYNFVYQPVRGPSGRFESILSISHEVTDIVRAREQAARLVEEEKERAAFEQQLIGIVSHDLRNPLGAILFGTSILLGRKDLDERTAKTIRRIHSSGERATALVKDVLDFTQARLGGGLPVRRAPMDAHAVARQVAEELQVNFTDRQIRVEAMGDGSADWDSERVSQVLMNLASNALKYGRTTAPITLRTRGEGDAVVLEVHNENAGAPIPQEAIAGLFEPLQRGTTQADRLGRSVGLGLYIVKHIVEAHGGTIGVTSSAEAGTSFTVRLPRWRVESAS